MNTLLYISVIPVILIWFYIYEKDKNKEHKKIIGKLFGFGILSCIVTLIISEVLGFVFPFFKVDRSELNLIELFIQVMIGVALVEEFSKWIMVYKIAYNNKEFDEFYDMIVYSVAVTLGFALFENILYVFTSGVGTGILRALLAVPGHACDGVFMGYYLGLAKISNENGNKSLKKKNLILSIVVPTLLHGFYDYCLFSEKILLIILFFVFIITLDIMAIKKVKKISKITVPFKDKTRYCIGCGRRLHDNDNYCEMCGRKTGI